MALELLDQFRNEEISVIVSHELLKMAIDRVKNLVNQSLTGVLEHRLQELTALLLGGKSQNIVSEHFELGIGVVIKYPEVALDLL